MEEPEPDRAPTWVQGPAGSPGLGGRGPRRSRSSSSNCQLSQLQLILDQWQHSCGFICM